MDSIPSLGKFTDEINLKYVLAAVIVLALALSVTQLEMPEWNSSLVEASITVSTPEENITREVSVENTTTVFEALNTTFEVNYSK